MSDRNVQASGGVADQRPPLLSTGLATPRQKRVALVIAVVSFVAAAAIVPFAGLQLHAVHAFIPSYGAALVLVDLITALLLFDQVLRVRSFGMLLLASAYLFDALITVAHALSYPGAFTPGGLLGAREQTTAWLYVFWHGGFSLFVLGYALWERRGGARAAPWTEQQTRRAIALAAIAVTALVIGLVLLATLGHDLLPVVIQGGNYTPMVDKGISPAMWVLTLLAIVALRRRELRVIDLWLMLVVFAWLLDITLSAVAGSTRYDLGFYAGRLFGLIAASFLLLTLLVETIRLYSGALTAAASAEEKLAQWARSEAAEGFPGTRRPAGDVEVYVLKENVARYRSMLRSTTLAAAQRQTVAKLLDAEEEKLRVANGKQAG